MLEVLKELKLRRENREADFWTTARKLAVGEKVTTASVEKVLAENGKTLVELQTAVELFTQRARWNEQRRQAAALEKEQTSVQNRIAAEDRKLAAAEAAHNDATAPLYARVYEIRAAVSDASDARRKLIETCPDEALRAQLAAVGDRLAALRAQAVDLRDRGELVKDADRDEQTAERLQAGIVPLASTAHIDRMREQAARKREAGEQAKAGLAGVLKDIVAAEKEQEAVYERMARP